MERGVAGETEVGAVSHLFYVYLLSALQRGQRVEVPNFGTFGTRVAGVKRTRKIPYFEPEQDLARKVNQRFENLRSLVTGKYIVTPQAGDTEYRGPQAPYDPTVERGKEYIFDTNREVSLDEYERAAASGTKETQPEEDQVMPRLNLQDEEEGAGIPPEREESPITPPPTLRDVGPDGGRKAPWLAIIVILLVLAAAVVSLNYFHVIHLWGKKVPRVVEQIPESIPPTEPSTTGEQATTPPAAGQEETPLPSVTPGKPATKKTTPSVTAPPVAIAPSGAGKYTVQVSSWKSRVKANREAQELSTAGFEAYVMDGDVNGESWHRVRVGRFGTMREARDAIVNMQAKGVDGVWITTID